MKMLLSFLAGSAVTTGAVVLAGGYHAGMVILGGILTITLLVALTWGLGIPRVSRWLLAFHNANGAIQSAHAEKPLVVTDRPIKRQKHHSQRPQIVVNSSKTNMLRPTQQDVVSALVNMGVSMNRAERIVLDCANPGDSFDELFRKAVTMSSKRRTA